MTFNGASNPTKLDFEYDRDCDWLPMFRGATFGKLEDITFRPESKQIDDPLEAFERSHLPHPSRTQSRSSVSIHHARGTQTTPLSFHSRN